MPHFRKSLTYFEVSIPHGTIKRNYNAAYQDSYLVSIPQGTIKRRRTRHT